MRRLTLLLLVLASCGKEPEASVPQKSAMADPAPESTPDPVPDPDFEPTILEPAAPPPRPSGPQPLPPPPPMAPRLSLTANGSDVPQVPPGTPILLELWLTAPPGASLSIRSSGASWASFVRLSTPGPEWPFRAAMNVGPSVKLDAGNAAVLVWTLPEKAVDALPRGEHRIGVTFDVREGAAPDSWVGLVQPPPIVVRLTSGPPTPSRTGLRVRCALWERANDEALRLVEAELAERKGDPELLALKAEVLEASGRPQEALQSLDEAIAQAARRGSAADLYRSLRAALRGRIDSAGK